MQDSSQKGTTTRMNDRKASKSTNVESLNTHLQGHLKAEIQPRKRKREMHHNERKMAGKQYALHRRRNVELHAV